MIRSASAQPPLPPVSGRIRRRLLLNAAVDPEEAASRLPAGLRPHVTGAGTVVGCCLLEIEDLRPRRLPGVSGVTMRAVAHRISAEWRDDTGDHVVGVFVPGRRTTSRLAVALGGRAFPGVHRLADIDIAANPGGFSWRVDDGDGFEVAVTASLDEVPGSTPCEPIGATALAATIGVSPGRRGGLEAARMVPARRDARCVTLSSLRSRFLDSFTTARPAPAYLMEHVPVTWTRAPAPSTTQPHAFA